MEQQIMNDPEKDMTFKSWIALIGAIVGAFMAILDIQITNASIREVTGGLSTTIEDGSWISTAYLVAEIVIIPLSGWLTTVFSLRNYLLGTSVLFLFFSVCCGFAWNLPTMIIFRAFQGMTGGALIPLAFQIILSLPKSKRTMGTALFMITATFAPAIGPTVGGYLTDVFHWPVIFYVNLLPGMIFISMVSYGVEREKAHLELLKGADFWGIFTMTIGLSSLTIFLEEGQKDDWFGSRFITSLCISAIVFIALFVWIELTSEKPFINLRLLGRRNFGFGSLVNLIVGVSLYGALFLLPLYLATVQGYNSINIGKTMMWAGIPQLLVLPLLPRMMPKIDSRWMAVLGLILFSASCFMNSQMSVRFGIDQLMWSQLVRAIGQPMIMVPLSTITTGFIEASENGSASGLFNMLRNLGGSFGIALLSTVLTVREQFHSVRLMERVTIYETGMQIRITNLQKFFIEHGFDATTALNKTYAAIGLTVHRQASVMAFNDCFLFLSVSLFLGAGLVLIPRRVTLVAGGSAAH